MRTGNVYGGRRGHLHTHVYYVVLGREVAADFQATLNAT